ncbi:MAG: hypothetical protein HY548_05095 [Elusimicrobia bacterium]|nr:hypothetical protein [Elusimicrobiota bacterium]
MTEAEFWELIQRAREGVPLNETQKEAIRQYLKGRLSPDSVKAFEKDFIPKNPPPSQPWWTRLFTWKNLGRLGVYGALIYLLGAAIADRIVEPPQISGGSGPCKISAGTKPLHVNPSSTGPNRALKAAIEELESRCAESGLDCSGGTCPSCAPDVAVQSVDIKCRFFWYTAEVTAICQCWCK